MQNNPPTANILLGNKTRHFTAAVFILWISRFTFQIMIEKNNIK